MLALRMAAHQISMPWLDATVAQNRDAWLLARQRYDGGVASFIEVLDAERTLQQNQLSLAESSTTVGIDLVSLYLRWVVAGSALIDYAFVSTIEELDTTDLHSQTSHRLLRPFHMTYDLWSGKIETPLVLTQQPRYVAEALHIFIGC